MFGTDRQLELGESERARREGGVAHEQALPARRSLVDSRMPRRHPVDEEHGFELGEVRRHGLFGQFVRPCELCDVPHAPALGSQPREETDDCIAVPGCVANGRAEEAIDVGSKCLGSVVSIRQLEQEGKAATGHPSEHLGLVRRRHAPLPRIAMEELGDRVPRGPVDLALRERVQLQATDPSNQRVAAAELVPRKPDRPGEQQLAGRCPRSVDVALHDQGESGDSLRFVDHTSGRHRLHPGGW